MSGSIQVALVRFAVEGAEAGGMAGLDRALEGHRFLLVRGNRISGEHSRIFRHGDVSVGSFTRSAEGGESCHTQNILRTSSGEEFRSCRIPASGNLQEQE